MSGLSLHIKTESWRAHLRRTVERGPHVVPVAKGNGYGFGLERLAAEAELLGVPALAVGLASEVAQVREAFSGDLVILTPWRGESSRAVEVARDPRVISTVSRLVDLEPLANLGGDHPPRVVFELLTSMKRHGMDAEDARSAAGWEDAVTFEGWTIHLPLLDEGRMAEARRLGRLAQELRPGPIWISHLSAEEANHLAQELGVEVRLRLGTSLWLGDPSSLRTTARVVDLHRVARGERVGYRQRRVARDGWLVVLAGGTAHGVGLVAPSAATTMRSRAIALAEGGLEASGRALSPFTLVGEKRWFLEPPHMQSSLVLLPGDLTPPEVGEEVPVELRLTTATVDDVIDE